MTDAFSNFINRPRAPSDKEKLIVYHIDEIESYMDPEDFQREFFESLSEQWKRRGFLSPKQMTALYNIYERVTR